MTDIDREVAERVMGWTFLQNYYVDTGMVRFPSDWSPSTRIDHAWEVVEKITNDSWFMQMNVYRFPKDQSEPWIIEVVGHDAETQTEASAKTAPLAICKAALAAMEES